MTRAKASILLCSLFALVCTGGCFRYHAAHGDPTPPVPLESDAWVVSADTSGIERLLDTPSELALWAFDHERLREKHPEITQGDITRAESQVRLTMRRSEIRNGGIVRIWGERASGVSWQRTLSRGLFSIRLEDFETGGTYLSADRYAFLEARDALSEGPLENRLIEVLLRGEGIRRTSAERDWRLRDGIRIGLPDAATPGDDDHEPPARMGTFVHVASFYENAYEHRVLDRLAGYGWAIGHIGTDITIHGPNAIARYEQQAKRREFRRELLENDPEYQQIEQDIADRRATQQEMDRQFQRLRAVSDEALERYPAIDTGLEVYPDTDLRAHAQLLAGIMDSRIAEHAYAAEALIEESDRQNPSLADRPIVVMGFSAGALVSPAVVERMRQVYPHRAIALVMVGGGGDLLSASIGSVFEQARIDMDPREGPDPTREQLDELVEHYRAASKLDPLMLAPTIRDIPTLHIYASRDTVVPSATAEAFNAAHGHADRLVHPLNHDTLFFFVPGEVGRIRSWLRSHGLAD